MRDHFQDNMERGRGGSTVRVYATTEAMYRARGGNVGPGTWEHTLAVARGRWRDTVAQAIADYDYAINGDKWEGLEL
jgi:hypothetical protein